MAPEERSGGMDGEMKTAAVNGIGIAYRRVGRGAPIIAVHGGGIGHTYLRPLDAWAGEVQVVYYDQRGCGATPVGDPGRLTFAGALSDLYGFARRLGLDRMNLVGHSLGALIALMFAATYPERVASLILLNAAPPFVPELEQRLWANMAARRSPEDDAEKRALETSAGFARRDPEVLERHTLNVYTPFFSDRSWRDRADLGFTQITAANVAAAQESLLWDLHGESDPVGALARVECPTLVVHSENDVVPEDFSRLLADKIGSAEYQFLGGASHFVHFEDPPALAAAVVPFLHSFASGGAISEEG